jgi:hypothetical protein
MRLLHILVSFDAFMAVMFLVFVFWVVIPHSVVVGYQCFRGLWCLHLQGEVADVEENGIDVGPDWRGAAGVAS